MSVADIAQMKPICQKAAARTRNIINAVETALTVPFYKASTLVNVSLELDLTSLQEMNSVLCFPVSRE